MTTSPPVGIGEAAARLGLEPDTLRYFERRGIVPTPTRDGRGRRVYTEDHLHLVEVLQHLRRTGMPLAEIAEFTALVAGDPDGVPERLTLLLRHRERVQREQQALARSMVVIEQKIRDYRQRLDPAATDPTDARGPR